MKFFLPKKNWPVFLCNFDFLSFYLLTIDLIHTIVIDANGLLVPPIGSFILRMITIEIEACPTIYIETK